MTVLVYEQTLLVIFQLRVLLAEKKEIAESTSVLESRVSEHVLMSLSQ